MWPKTAFCRNFLPLQTVNVVQFQRKIQLTGLSAYRDFSPSQLILINGVTFCLFLARQPPVGYGLLIHEVSKSHTTTHHSR